TLSRRALRRQRPRASGFERTPDNSTTFQRRRPMTSLMILIAGPYRSGTGDDPEKMAANVKAIEAFALPLFRAGHIPIVGMVGAANGGARWIDARGRRPVYRDLSSDRRTAGRALRCGAAHRWRLCRRRRDGGAGDRAGPRGLPSARRCSW